MTTLRKSDSLRAGISMDAMWSEIMSAAPRGSWIVIGGPYDSGRFSASIYTTPQPDRFPGTDERRPRDRWHADGLTPEEALRGAEREWFSGRSTVAALKP